MRTRPTVRLNRRQKIAAIAAASALGALSALGGTYAAFTAQAIAPAQTIQSGTVAIDMSGGSFGTEIENTSPGDVSTRDITLKNTGSIAYSTVTMSQVNVPEFAGVNIADKYSVKVVRLAIGTDAAWGTADDVPDMTTPVLNEITLPAYGATTPTLALTNSEKIAGAATHLRFIYTFDATANDTFQGKCSTITFTVNATQRAAGTFVETSPTGSINGL